MVGDQCRVQKWSYVHQVQEVSIIIQHGSHKDWKPGEMRKLFPVREKSENFEHTGKVKEFYPRYWKREGILASFYFKFSLIFLK